MRIRVASVFMAVSLIGASVLGGCVSSGSDPVPTEVSAQRQVGGADIVPEEQGSESSDADEGSGITYRPRYEDERWPTTNSQLLAIPESQRYYNAWDHVWTTCTVAGPVVNVYQAWDSAGAPIFINIGARYPSSECVTLVVWADSYGDFAEMIDAVDDGGAWLSVTGYLSEYDGGLQFDSGDGYVEYTWWTGVS